MIWCPFHSRLVPRREGRLMAARARCRRAPNGWWCSRTPGHDDPCAARPKWWNLRGILWMWR